MDDNIKELWKAIVRLAVDQARNITDDQKALTVKSLYKEWNAQLGKTLNVGEYVQHEDKLYKVLQQHTAQETWEPGVGTESIYIVIDKEHSGNMDDPIPWTTNMECFNGKYYTEDNTLYLCIRDSGIALHFNIKDLIGSYFKKVEE